MNYFPSAALWILAYLAVVTAPLFLLLSGRAPSGGGFWWDFAMALGFAAAAMFGAQFLLTARFKRATAPFGIDIIYYFHRYLAVLALGLLAAHWLIARLDNPAALGSADPRVAAPHMTAARMALTLLVLMVAISLARRQLGLNYETWRSTHALFASAAVALALWHILGSGRFLGEAWKQVLWLGYGATWIGVIAYVRLWRPWRIARTPWRVAEVRPERGGVSTLALEPRGHPGIRFQPGQFAWLTLRASPFAMREHPFSIASAAEEGHRLELAIKAVGDFTRAIAQLRPGDTAYVDAPYGAFSTDRHPGAPGYVFVAGGIGIAPVLSMLRTLAQRGERRPLSLFYGNRVWERVAFREALDRLAERLALKVVHVLDEPPYPASCESGLITREILERHLPAGREAFDYFLCGPVPMTRSVERSLAALGVPAARVHSEIFDWV